MNTASECRASCREKHIDAAATSNFVVSYEFYGNIRRDEEVFRRFLGGVFEKRRTCRGSLWFTIFGRSRYGGVDVLNRSMFRYIG